jgi:hypothetical protein
LRRKKNLDFERDGAYLQLNEAMFSMMTLRQELGCKARRESAIAATCLRSPGHFSLVTTLPGRPSNGKDWIKPGS